MVSNIESIVERGERLDLIVDKAENLSNESVTFRQSGRRLQRRMWWQNARMKVRMINEYTGPIGFSDSARKPKTCHCKQVSICPMIFIIRSFLGKKILGGNSIGYLAALIMA